MTSPPSLTQAIVELSRLGKYSLDPGCADVGRTRSLIFAQVSDSLGLIGAPSMGGNGHNPHGSPGHKQPWQLAWTGSVSMPSHTLAAVTMISFEILLSPENIVLSFY